MSVFAFSSKLFSLTTGALIWSLCACSVMSLMVHIVDSLFAVGSGDSVSSSICPPVSSTGNGEIEIMTLRQIFKQEC